MHLRELDAEQRRRVDELLVRVYAHAARELEALERQRVTEIHRRDQKLAETYAKARAELMRSLNRWQESKGR